MTEPIAVGECASAPECAESAPAQSTASGPYQVCPPMTPLQFEDLKLDIAERGVLTPIDVDEEGRILDGHHRIRACRELGITTWPTFVRVGLSDVEKRTYARQANTLRRHLTRAQLRDLIAGQLRDTPQWADARIARALGTSDKTVRATRRLLEATSEIPRLTTFEGTDGKMRSATQPTRAIFLADGGDVAFDKFARLAKQAGELPAAERPAFWTAQGIATITSDYEPFAGFSEVVVREWHLLTLFLVRQHGWSVDAAARHVEWIAARFSTPSEWFSDEGAQWRRRVGMRRPIDAAPWIAFAETNRDRTSADLIPELRSLNPSLGGQAPSVHPAGGTDREGAAR